MAFQVEQVRPVEEGDLNPTQHRMLLLALQKLGPLGHGLGLLIGFAGSDLTPDEMVAAYPKDTPAEPGK